MTTSGRKELGAELLLTERDALLPILRTLEPDQFDLETCCTGWAVRDVLAHCSAALTRVSSGTMHRFRPQDIAQIVKDLAPRQLRRGIPKPSVQPPSGAEKKRV